MSEREDPEEANLRFSERPRLYIRADICAERERAAWRAGREAAADLCDKLEQHDAAGYWLAYGDASREIRALPEPQAPER